MAIPLSPEVVLIDRRQTGEAALQRALLNESAANLGRLGRAVQSALARLHELDAFASAAEREAVLYACADAVWQYFVQREVCGLVDHRRVIESYAIPVEVLRRVGGSPRPSSQPTTPA